MSNCPPFAYTDRQLSMSGNATNQPFERAAVLPDWATNLFDGDHGDEKVARNRGIVAAGHRSPFELWGQPTEMTVMATKV